MIKLICSDIDGTLVADGTMDINPELFDVILQLKAKGIHFAAASGRQAASIEAVFDPVKDKIFYIAENGGYIGCYGRELIVQKMEPKLIAGIVQDLRELKDCEIMVCGTRNAYIESKNERFLNMLDQYQGQFIQVEDVLKSGDAIVKMSAFREEDLEHFLEPVTEKWKEKVQVVTSGTVWIDFMGRGVNKGQAVKELQTALHITPEETMVFGDQINDIHMLQSAYYSYAVANARPEAKAAARFQTGSYQEDGVLKVLKGLLKKLQ